VVEDLSDFSKRQAFVRHSKACRLLKSDKSDKIDLQFTSESVGLQCAMLKACDAYADMGQL